MREKLESLWRAWCAKQGIESGPLSMADIADFFDYVELWTDALEDDGK